MLRKDLKCSFRLKGAVWVVEDRLATALLISRWVSVYLWIFFFFFVTWKYFVEDGTGKGEGAAAWLFACWGEGAGSVASRDQGLVKQLGTERILTGMNDLLSIRAREAYEGGICEQEPGRKSRGEPESKRLDELEPEGGKS